MIWILNAIQGGWNLFVATIGLAISFHVLRLIAIEASAWAPEKVELEGRSTWKRPLVHGYLLFALAVCTLAVLGQAFSLEFLKSARQGAGQTPWQGVIFWVALFPPTVWFLLAKIIAFFKGYIRFFKADRNESPTRTVFLSALVLVAPLVVPAMSIEVGSREYQFENLLQTIGFSLFLYFYYFQPGYTRWRREALEALGATPREGVLAHHAGLRRAHQGFFLLSRVLPPRLTREEFGDALERAEALVHVGEKSWRIDLLWLSTVAVALGNTIRDLPRWLLERARSRGGRA